MLSPPPFISEPNRHSPQASKSPVFAMQTSHATKETSSPRPEPARLTHIYVEHPRGVGRPDCVLAVALYNLCGSAPVLHSTRASSLPMTTLARIVIDTSPPPSPHTGLIGSTRAGKLTSLCSDPTLSFSRAQPLRTRSDYTGGEGACASSISRD